MKAEEQTKLNETLSKVFKLDTEQLATLYNEAGDLTDLTVVTDADTKRVAKFNTDKTAQYNRGIKEGAEKIEKVIKEKYEVESDLIGVELVDQIVLKQTEAVTKANPKDVTKHPDYIKLESSFDKKLKEKDKEWEGKLALKEAEFKKEKLFEKIKDRSLLNLRKRNPILPSDPMKAKVWEDTYLNELKAGNYQESEDGVPIVLDEKGEIKKDKHGNAITFDEFEKSISDKYFEYPVSTPRNSPGNQPPGGQPGSGTGEPKTVDECLEKLRDPKITPVDRKKWTDLMDNLKNKK